MQAGPDALTLRAEALDKDGLQQVQDLITGQLERFGRRDNLKVSWQRPEADQAGGPRQQE